MKPLHHVVAAWTMLGFAILADAQVAPIVLDGNVAVDFQGHFDF